MKSLVLVIGSVILAVIAACLIHQWNNANYTTAHQMAHTQSDLRIIAEAVEMLEYVHGDEDLVSSLRDLNPLSLHRLLSTTNHGVRVLQPRPSWDSRGELTDRWDRPLRVSVTFGPKSMAGSNSQVEVNIKVWSRGPNGRDENGAGDDIGVNIKRSLVGSLKKVAPMKASQRD